MIEAANFEMSQVAAIAINLQERNFAVATLLCESNARLQKERQ
jgi:hypothetical protein